jgi:hypothetical protein
MRSSTSSSWMSPSRPHDLAWSLVAAMRTRGWVPIQAQNRSGGDARLAARKTLVASNVAAKGFRVTPRPRPPRDLGHIRPLPGHRDDLSGHSGVADAQSHPDLPSLRAQFHSEAERRHRLLAIVPTPAREDCQRRPPYTGRAHGRRRRARRVAPGARRLRHPASGSAAHVSSRLSAVSERANQVLAPRSRRRTLAAARACP